MFKATGNTRRDLERVSALYSQQLDKILGYKERIAADYNKIKRLEKSLQKERKDNEEKDAIIRELKKKLLYYETLENRNGTNSGIPTSQTPIDQKKHIPNTRVKSNKSKGGQIGHKKESMKGFQKEEIDKEVLHNNNESICCASCGGALTFTGRYIDKDEFDIEIKTVKRRHKYAVCQCAKCQKETHQKIPNHLKEQTQYGSMLKAVATSVMVTGNMAVNKVRQFLRGITGYAVEPSEGFICSLYTKSAKLLKEFLFDLKTLMVRRSLLYWDDTVIMVMTKRCCMRFYGDETIAYYTAHEKKDLDGLIEDNILDLLTKETKLMHDHNTVNYNDRFLFLNIECLQHLQRDLQKSADDNPDHTWAKDLKSHIGEWIDKRKKYMAGGKEEFMQEEQEEFNKKVRELLQKGKDERQKSTNPTTVPSEKTLIARLEKYYENYFMWIKDFQIPTTNNLSERRLRGIKSHMKISGQFDNIRTAGNYADLKTYVETCKLNGINEMDALVRLFEENPYTVKEIFG